MQSHIAPSPQPPNLAYHPINALQLLQLPNLLRRNFPIILRIPPMILHHQHPILRFVILMVPFQGREFNCVVEVLGVGHLGCVRSVALFNFLPLPFVHHTNPTKTENYKTQGDIHRALELNKFQRSRHPTSGTAPRPSEIPEDSCLVSFRLPSRRGGQVGGTYRRMMR